MRDPAVAGTADANEQIYLASERISWALRENLSLSLSYAFTKVESDIALRSYNRNIVTLSAAYIF